ncbi:MAG: hypothetical protein JXM72_12995 [Deltaproteobacteria bacterium]|nr:hypothetical protein [Deltaproteobacteria bacterium]
MIEGICDYQDQPPFDSLAVSANSMFGIVSVLTVQGVEVLESCLARNDSLNIRLIVTVYPACATREKDLSCLEDLVLRADGRLVIHIKPLERVTDRTPSTLCFLEHDKDVVHMVTGLYEDLGLKPFPNGHAAVVFKADPVLVDSFRSYFNWLWGKSADITSGGVPLIPNLVLPEGTEEGAKMWQDYLLECSDSKIVESMQHTNVRVDPESGDVAIISEDGKEMPPPTDEIGLTKLDRLSEFVAKIYEKGSLVSIDKMSRIPPLDAPIDPRIFGDVSELQKGAVTRRVNARVSIIDEKTLKEIERRRQGVRTLLTKFTFGLADNMRWMPFSARGLFESELRRLNVEGKKLVKDLLKGDVNAFIESRRKDLIGDINAMYGALGRQGQATDEIITMVTKSLKERLEKAQTAQFTPKLSYSSLRFVRTDSALASPWGQAYSLLKDIAVFPRKALTDNYFFRGLKVPEEELIDAMNVADDALSRGLDSRGIKNRCRAELELIDRIEFVPMESRDRCELVYRIIAGDPVEEVDKVLNKKETP